MSAHLDFDAALIEQAQFETTSRIIAALLNERLIDAIDGKCPISPSANGIFLTRRASQAPKQVIWIATVEQSHAVVARGTNVFHPADLRLPVLVRSEASASSEFVKETEPAAVLTAARCLFDIDEKLFDEDSWKQILGQVTNSSQNQLAWFRWAMKQPRPQITSSALDWEQALVTGHPAHPMHRSCVSQKPLAQILPCQAPTLLHPSMSIIAVDRAAVKISGPFRRFLEPLLANFDLPTLAPNDVVLPCLSRQWPAIQENFPSAYILIPDALEAEAQASIRTVTIPSKYRFQWHLKTALACTITSALRTVTPWTACVGPELSEVLKDLVSDNLWIASEVASITGSQASFDQAKHISCILREDLEPRAESLNQSLIICAALAERPYGSSQCYAELTFDLHDTNAKMAWLTEYTSVLVESILSPALDSGICLEAHGQNMLVRVDKTSKNIVGFAARDVGGIKCHMPTLRRRGYDLLTALPGSFVVSDDEEEAWGIVQHTLINNHLHHLIRRLRVPQDQAWQMVRDQIDTFFNRQTKSGAAKRFRDFLFQPEVHSKAFLRMKMQGLYRDYVHTTTPNVLLTR
ncbi:NRPS-independent siderophore synthetase rfs [Pseudocercospora fuligena]|uniref:NRPS-independent siderophore synthetase rfs n=1 Tax=Pseudocercospora fuligena TaxID=685502 RepID=A0A8H6RNJ4_9PEZI|nr:NRPS-independent siderophore synthetase rfs [Pseudocercospora fuligena]